MNHGTNASRRHAAPEGALVVLLATALFLLAASPAGAAADTGMLIDRPGSYSLDHDLAGGVMINTSDVVLDGMGHAISAGTGWAVFATGPSDGPITNVTVRNLTARDSSGGIYIGHVNGSVIEDAVLERNGVGLGCGYAGMGGAGWVLIRDSVIRDSTGAGISLQYPSDGITIERCTVTGNAPGLEADLSGRLAPNSLLDSEVSENDQYGVSLRESGLTVRGCTIRGNGGNGIQLEHAGATIEGNRIEDNAGIGVDSTDRGGSNITSNRITGNGQGVSLGGDWSSLLVNNYLNNTDNGFFGAAEAGMLNVTKTAGPNIVGGPFIGGNAWAKPDGTGFSQTHADGDGDGFCDEPYVINEDVTDFLPLALTIETPGDPPASLPPRYVVGDLLAIGTGNQTRPAIVASVDTTSLPTPYYTLYDAEENGERWEIPRYWHQDQKVDEQNLVENLHAFRIGHVDPVNVVITDTTITGGDQVYAGLSLWEVLHGAVYWVEDSGNSPLWLTGDISNGTLIAGVLQPGDDPYYTTYGVTHQGERWYIEKYWHGEDNLFETWLWENGFRRTAHADPHFVVVNDTTLTGGDIGYYGRTLAELKTIGGYWAENWEDRPDPAIRRYDTGDVLGNDTSPDRYVVANATEGGAEQPQYTLYPAVPDGDGWRLTRYPADPLVLDAIKVWERAMHRVDHTDPHFAVVDDPSVTGGITFDGLSLGEILEGTPGYPPESLPPIGGAGDPPLDTDGDGLYDDVNGNGRADFADVVLFFNRMDWIAAHEPLMAFDCNGNGRIDFADVVWLFNRL
ncbi:MAG: hypothetical protein GXY82_03180 [Methanospirillum sp.]|nr:hypothetical protein [Methanospirillum sp.]